MNVTKSLKTGRLPLKPLVATETVFTAVKFCRYCVFDDHVMSNTTSLICCDYLGKNKFAVVDLPWA